MSVVRTILTGHRFGFRLKRSNRSVRYGFKHLGNNSKLFIFFTILSIILMLLSLHKHRQLSSSIDQLNSRVSLLESIIEKSKYELGSKIEDIIEKSNQKWGGKVKGIQEILESIIEKSNHEWGSKVEYIVEKSNHKWGSKVEDIVERLESIIEKTNHKWGSKVEDIAHKLESIIEKSEHEWKSKEEDIAETKKMNMEKEEIIVSKQNKNDPNQLIPALKIRLLNITSNLGFLTSKISEAFLVSINTIVTIVEKSLSSSTTFIKDSYNCVKPYIIGLVKITMWVLIELGKVIVSLAIIVIKLSIQLLIGLVKTLASLTILVRRILQLSLKVAR